MKEVAIAFVVGGILMWASYKAGYRDGEKAGDSTGFSRGYSAAEQKYEGKKEKDRGWDPFPNIKIFDEGPEDELETVPYFG